ncbi:MAG: hydrogenase maturation nickel metallochaperone HypA [Clostridiales Family XIII bacterium]|jgi:hydrogenase nickel incorporation protein HypA/HybF|nr:hydrogenase maturation nickel metallochaperone HypA [Clostridiales Family XIII bacterium]
MHEYPITQRIVDIATRHGQDAGASRVSRIALVVGERSGYIPESIRMYFDILAKGTLCEGAALDVTAVKPLLRCLACGLEFERRPYSFACPACGADGGPTDVGKEFYIASIEVV